MTIAISDLTSTAPDGPRQLKQSKAPVDRVFHGTVRTIALLVLVIFGSIGVFLALQSVPTFKRYGFSFITQAQWQPEIDKIGISSTLLGTVEVAFIALIISFPLALATALFISEYAPARMRSFLVALIDLMAAVPSIIYGLWGSLLLEPHAKFVARWLNQNLGWIPLFRVNADPNSASWAQSRYVASAFIAGICVSMMVIPIACAVMRGVFAQAPIIEREAAYALGATRWGMVRTVVLPFGRGGIIGGTMLGLGRALGETVAVLLIISLSFRVSFRVLEAGTSTISALIAARFGDATNVQLHALMTAGLALFLITLVVNSIAAIFVSRSRSGAATEA